MSSMREIVEKNNSQPLFTANEHGQVMKRSIMTLNKDGSANSTLGFPVCEVPEYVSPRYELAQHIAHLLNTYGEEKPKHLDLGQHDMREDER